MGVRLRSCDIGGFPVTMRTSKEKIYGEAVGLGRRETKSEYFEYVDTRRCSKDRAKSREV